MLYLKVCLSGNILNISTLGQQPTQKTTEDRGREQTIVHFESLGKVNENKFNNSLDPIVIYRKKGAQVQISVQPFNFDNKDKEGLSFVDKLSHFSRISRTLYSNVVLEDIVVDTTISIDSFDLGTYNDFLISFNNPLDNKITVDRFFGSVFMELQDTDLTKFTNGITGAIYD